MRFADEVHSTLNSHLKYIGFAVLTGICVYFSLMSNNLVNNLDGIWHSSNFIAGNWEISLGRGLQRYADRARFGLVTSAWNSIIVFILIGMADSLIIARFRLRDTLFSYLLVFATISNPIVCESLSYCYMSVNFGLAYFFSVLSFMLISGNAETKKKILFTCLLSSLAFGISMAFYQAYICVYAVLCIYLILVILKKEKALLKAAQKSILCIVVFMGGGIVYYTITQLLLWRAGTEMAAYRGANNIGIIEIIKNIPMGIITAYKESWNYFWVDRLNAKMEFSNIVIILTYVTIVIFTIISLYDLFKKSKKHMVFSVAIVLFLPVAASVICVVAVGNLISGLMAMGILMSVLMFYTFVDDRKCMKLIMNCVLIIISWYLVSAVINDQIALKEGIKATERITEDILTQAASSGLLENVDSVAFIGRAAENPLFYKSTAYEMANEYAQFGRWSTDARNNRVTWNGITEIFCGTSLPFCGDDTYLNIIQSNHIKDMPIYPQNGYMAIIDNVLVVKISDLY